MFQQIDVTWRSSSSTLPSHDHATSAQIRYGYSERDENNSEWVQVLVHDGNGYRIMTPNSIAQLAPHACRVRACHFHKLRLPNIDFVYAHMKDIPGRILRPNADPASRVYVCVASMYYVHMPRNGDSGAKVLKCRSYLRITTLCFL